MPYRTFPLEEGRTNPIQLLLGGLELMRLESSQVDALGAWVDQCGESVSQDQLKEPTLGLNNYLQHGSSVTALAATEWDTVKKRAGHYERDRVDDLARLLIAASLLTRFRASVSRSETSIKEAQVVAKARGWTNLADVIEVLKTHERRLITLGKAALIDQPEDQEVFLEDKDDGSYDDAFDDVRRRLDLAHKHPTLFAAVGLDDSAIQALEALLQDATIFHRGREGAGTPAHKITVQRDLAFSLSIIELKKLQAILEAAFIDRPELQQRIEGAYWRRVDSFARKRRPRKTDTDAGQPPADGGTTPVES